MKMLRSEKNFILSQVEIVLSELQSLVSKLNSVQCEDEEESMSDVTNISWDSSQDFPVYSMSNAFYTLVFPESSDEEDFEIGQENCQRKSVNKECSFVNKINAFITSSFPNAVYNKERSDQIRQNILDKNVFPEFQSMWRHSIVGDLFIQNPDSAQISTTTSPTPEIVFKTIDFSRVNVRNMANIPKPASCPVHGCSEDPKFYSEIVKLDSVDYYGRHYTSPCRHQTSAPFGSLFGYQTDDGIVPVPDTPVHGHVWSDQLRDWVLHAVFPDDCSPAPAPWRGTRSPTTRPPSTRRGWSTSRPRREGKG